MTSLTIQLPDELVAEAGRAGLLNTTTLSMMLNEMLMKHRKMESHNEQQFARRQAAVTTMLNFMENSTISQDTLKSWIEDGRE
jgi:hypothetical protein